MKAIVSINGVSPPCEPMSMTVRSSDLYSDSTKRSAETGKLLPYLIRKDIVTIELEYLLSESQTAEFEELISSLPLSVEFYDCGNLKKTDMYTSDRTKEMLGTAENRIYRLTFSLIEI